jgi:hypothetical protein
MRRAPRAAGRGECPDGYPKRTPHLYHARAARPSRWVEHSRDRPRRRRHRARCPPRRNACVPPGARDRMRQHRRAHLHACGRARVGTRAGRRRELDPAAAPRGRHRRRGRGACGRHQRRRGGARRGRPGDHRDQGRRRAVRADGRRRIGRRDPARLERLHDGRWRSHRAATGAVHGADPLARHGGVSRSWSDPRAASAW